MQTGLMLITLISLMIPAASSPQGSSSAYEVGEIIRILSGDSFECRLTDYAHSSAVRFRVRIRNMPRQQNEKESKERLAALLEDADRIELGNVRFRNYFRVDADLILEGNLLAFPQDTPEPIQEKPPRMPLRLRPIDITSHSPAEKPVSTVSKRSVSLKQLLRKPVDLSVLDAETSLAEALDILTHASDPPLPLVVFWSDLRDNALLGKNTPIGIEGFQTISVGLALDMILRAFSVTGPKLVVVAEGKVLTLGTEQTLLNDKKTEVYSIRDLTSPPSNVIW